MKHFFIAGLILLTACQTTVQNNEAAQDTTRIVIDPTALADDASNMPDENSPIAKTYDVRGVIIEIGATTEDGITTVSIDHEEIPDVMMAMRMNFNIDKTLLKGYQATDKIAFKVEQTETGYTVVDIKKLSNDTELKLKADKDKM